MDKGRILKVRIGHEADSSAGMVAAFILIVASVTHLPLSLIAAIVQAVKLEKDAPRKKWRILYWLVPQVLGLVLTAFLVRMATTGSLYGAESELLKLAYAIGLSFALAITAGYILAPRIRYLVCLIVPLIFVGGIWLFSWLLVIILS